MAVSLALGTNLLPTQVTRDSGTAVIAYASASGDSITYKDTGKAVIGTFSVDQTTKNTLLQLANCDNIPVEDLVQMEYESVYKRAEGVYDENWGDIFVVCLFDAQKRRLFKYHAFTFFVYSQIFAAKIYSQRNFHSFILI